MCINSRSFAAFPAIRTRILYTQLDRVLSRATIGKKCKEDIEVVGRGKGRGLFSIVDLKPRHFLRELKLRTGGGGGRGISFLENKQSK